MVEITIAIAFLAGLVSFLSPCILPLIPAYLSYLSGTTVEVAQKSKKKLNIFINALFFVLGFALVFSLVGVLLNTLLLNVAYDVRIWLSRIGGIIIIAFGLYLLGILKLDFLNIARKFSPKKFKYSYLTSFVFGVAFAAGWTPCVGAILGSILTLALTSPETAFGLLFSYSLGLGIPFLLSALFLSQALSMIYKLGPYLRYFTIAMGVVLVILGILVFLQYLPRLASLPFGINLSEFLSS